MIAESAWAGAVRIYRASLCDVSNTIEIVAKGLGYNLTNPAYILAVGTWKRAQDRRTQSYDDTTRAALRLLGALLPDDMFRPCVVDEARLWRASL